jgi:NitT/TauT family transport system permease protein
LKKSASDNQFETPLWQIAAPVGVTILLIGIWQFGVWVTGVPSIVIPSPLAVGAAVVREWPQLTEACGHTALAAMTGLAGSVALGVLIAFAFSQSRLIRSAFYPYAILLQTVPIIAIAPIVVLAVDRGFYGVALISMIISIFPIITSTTTGLLQIDPTLLELFQLHSASRWQTLWKLRLPNSLPYLISGIRIAGGAAIVGAIVGEFFVGSSLKGLGVLIERKKSGMDTDELYATVLMSTVLGVALFTIVTIVGEWVLRRFFAMSLSGQRR